MFSVWAKKCSNHDRGHMGMTITFVFTLTATSSVKHCIFVVVSSDVSKGAFHVVKNSENSGSGLNERDYLLRE